VKEGNRRFHALERQASPKRRTQLATIRGCYVGFFLSF
jgi:hypothetical protein